MDKIEIKIYRPFGPSYAHAKIPTRIVDTLNEYIDKIIDDKVKKSKLDFGNYLVGDVTQEFRLEKEISEKSGWLSFLGNCIDKWIEVELKKKITKLNVLDTWVVRQFKNEYNPIHYHFGHISGAGYLKVPNTFLDQIFRVVILKLFEGVHQEKRIPLLLSSYIVRFHLLEKEFSFDLVLDLWIL